MSEALQADEGWMFWGFVAGLVAGYVAGQVLSERYFERMCKRCQAKKVQHISAGHAEGYTALLVVLLYATVLVFTDTAFSRGWLARITAVVVGTGAGAFAAYAGGARDAWADCVLCHETGRPAHAGDEQ